ncbi:MAG: YggS family pyridoxal phosphate enzyme [Nitrospirae bacterium RIFOXYB2_FULL_43_5]|nr:MAG: YggS family pyridoxal phosphate enzyme [Nitrospirae bacterium GWF2_44_13]OGW34354.1 MAG: YggS family pyridoxal phosphate enzyme [Nitrospirae bacterium GWD2_44_7]OGW66463.1 MAG: YggS family pyridoxal phosphate enzyme [Nitrospirae bacterium RIFOXYA2_FULL_44_9]OGW73765.1 MAG: YggS family pyridoxal phosphate enzyme [Nitrospirae bacterium RIFOXYC2_FULL_44_7]OGW77528.1 MAG: YggS family pyridoxal phosphate enzyme [Nitrospirae bacterium RIFOXYB2_FULL_43_5]HBG92259.1 YggS family pyridoxal phosp
MTDTQLIENISRIYRRISEAAVRAGRKAEDIKLIAVTKTVGLQQIQEAVGAGLRIFGESKVQEAREKIQDSRCKMQDAVIQWHLIGHLQKNKAKTAVELFDIIHSVDSLDLAEAIGRHAEKIGKIQKILLQVKLSDEISKYGILNDNLSESIKEISEMENLSIKGLMAIPPFFENPENARPYFSELRTLRDTAETMGFNLPELSMGMTDDFEVAIEEGATMVRIGTAIFGKRKYCHKEAQ